MVQRKVGSFLVSNMSKNIKNNIKNVNIGGNYTGGDRNTIYSPPAEPSKLKWLVPIIIALIGAVAAIIAAMIK